MITREFGGDYAAGCAGAPPPLHVHPDNPGAAWYPLDRIVIMEQPPGPQEIVTPAVGVGDDPTDPGAQTYPRHTTYGMIPWLDATAGINIGQRGARK